MLAYQADEASHCFFLRNIKFHRFSSHVEIDLSGSPPDVAEISISHFSGAVDDTPYHRNPNTLEMPGSLADLLSGRLKVKQRATAAGAGHIVGLENPSSCSLEDIVTDAEALSGSVLSLNNDSVSYPITEKRADISRRRK